MSMTESEKTISQWVKETEAELQAYRTIGTVEELKTLHNDYWKLNEICKEYSAIGTVSELRGSKNFLEFLYNHIQPNEMEQYLAMYHAKELKGE